MIFYSKALDIIVREALKSNLRTEKVKLSEACGRISSKDIVCTEPHPRFDNSAMDGFALCSQDTIEANDQHPVRLNILGEICAGDETEQFSKQSIKQNHKKSCVSIMTGAAMPDSPFDAVIKIEDVKIVDGFIEVRSPIESGNFVRPKGEDFKYNDKIIKSNTPIEEKHILALATFGVDEIEVFEKPRIVIISTGKEVTVHENKNLKSNEIRNSTAPYLKIALEKKYGCLIVDTMMCGDSPEEFNSKLTMVLERGVDIVITTGAVSMGTQDYIPSILQKMGAEIFFHKTAIRPGKPGLFARFQATGPVIFGVPGNPLSTVVALKFFIHPYLRTLYKQERERPKRARLLSDIKKPEGLRCFFKATYDFENTNQEQGDVVSVHEGQASFMVKPLLESNAWVVLSEEESLAKKGTYVEVYPQ